MSQKIIQKDRQIAILEDENKKLTTELTKLKTIKSNSNNINKEKEIIQLYAYSLSNGFIFKVLNEEQGMDVTLSEIEELISKIDRLPPDLMEYYAKCKQAFYEKSEIDKNFLTSATIKKYSLIENELSVSLMKAKESNDEQLKIKVIDQLVKIYDKQSNLFMKGSGYIDKKQLNDILESYDNKKEEIISSGNIIQFKKSELKSV